MVLMFYVKLKLFEISSLGMYTDIKFSTTSLQFSYTTFSSFIKVDISI